MARSLGKNHGHKLLHVNPTEKGLGDDLVPDEHPEMLLNALPNTTKGKIVSMSINLNAEHGEAWWTSEQAREGVYQFLERTGLSQSLF